MTQSNLLEYCGYVGSVEADIDGRCLFGTVQGIDDVVHYEGRTIEEVIQAFHDSVDDYLDLCRTRGTTPNKPTRTAETDTLKAAG